MTSQPFCDIKIDRGKCMDAADCRICVDSCPGGVFTMYPVEKDLFAEGVPWQVNATFISLCTGCRVCQQNCPKGAIEAKLKNG